MRQVRNTTEIILGLGIVLGAHLVPMRLMAQDTTRQTTRAAQAAAGLRELASKRVSVVQSPVTVDPKTKIAKVQIYNPTSDTIFFDIELQFSEPPQHVVTAEALLTGARTVEDSLSRAQARSDSLEKQWSLIPWIAGHDKFPDRFGIRPGDTLTFEFQINVPDSAAPGTYSGHVTMRYIQLSNVGDQLRPQAEAAASVRTGRPVKLQKMNTFHVFPMPDHLVPRAFVKLVYVVEPNTGS
jgi:hypothetical protein